MAVVNAARTISSLGVAVSAGVVGSEQSGIWITLLKYTSK